MITREQIVTEARTWLNTPFHHQGRVKGVGADCAGIFLGVGNDLGLINFHTTDYARSPNSDQMQKDLRGIMNEIPIDAALPGDIYVFSFDEEPQHIGFITDIGILHGYAKARKCVEHSLDDVWKSRVKGAYRFRGLS